MTTASERMAALGPPIEAYLTGILTGVFDEPPARAEGERLRREFASLSNLASAEFADNPNLDAVVDAVHRYAEHSIAVVDSAERGDRDAAARHLAIIDQQTRIIMRAGRRATATRPRGRKRR